MIERGSLGSSDQDLPRAPLIPELCRPPALLLVLLVAAGLALALALITARTGRGFLTDFGLTMVYVQSVGLVSAGLLCLARRSIDRIEPWLQGLIAFSVIPLVSVVASAVVVVWLPAAVGEAGPAWLIARNLLLGSLVSLLLIRYLSLQQRWKLQVRAESSARLEALQARIRPHFLFNALNTIIDLVHDQPAAAEEALLDLSDLLRTGLRADSRQTLGEEIDLIEGYLRLEAFRLGDRLVVEWDLPADMPRDLIIPALLIQPLVENAIVHGIARRGDGGTLLIRARLARFRRLEFTIENPLAEDGGGASAGNRTALDNIRQRLELAYGERARLTTGQADGLFRATLILPLDY